MIKLLYLGDYVCNTGFGQVSRNIIKRLVDSGEYEVDILGINYNGDPYDHEEWPGNVYPARQGGMVRPPYDDVYGRQRFLDMLGSDKYDVAMILQDTFVIRDFAAQLKETANNVHTKMVYYYPVDSILDYNWVNGVVDIFDFPVTYTEYARAETLRMNPDLASKLSVIYHGNNFGELFHIEDRETVKKARSDYFKGKDKGRFIITNVARNQIRKDIIHSLLTIKEVQKTHPEALLYLHMSDEDQGGHIEILAAQMGLRRDEDYIVPYIFNKGVTTEMLNIIYNFSDMLLSTTHGEGWGLPLTEAFATKTPVIAPDNTAVSEIGADNRALLIECNNYASYANWDNSRLRPVIDYKQAAQTICDYIDGKVKPDIEAAHEWLRTYDWDNIVAQWDVILKQAYKLSQKLPVATKPKSVVAKKRKQERQNKKRARRG